MNSNSNSPRRSAAKVVREYVPIDENKIHGVTFDGKLVWFARDGELVAFDPDAEKVIRRHEVKDAGAGTAFDGKHLYQLAKTEIVVVEPDTGRVVRRMPAPGKGDNSGMAWADGFLWIGQFKNTQIHKVDARTGEVVKTLASDRFVTGVSCVDGALWHGAAYDGKPTELRKLAADGTVEEILEVPVAGVAGVEADGRGGFWCAGENGRLRLVQKSA